MSVADLTALAVRARRAAVTASVAACLDPTANLAAVRAWELYIDACAAVRRARIAADRAFLATLGAP